MESRISSEAGDTPRPPEPGFQARSKKRRRESFAPSENIFKRAPDGATKSLLPGIAAGVFAVDKPAGVTSHDVVDAVRDALGGAKAGHAGTLDPHATGVLVICLGAATKVSSFLIEGVKEYEGRGILGVATDTQDAAGTAIETREVACSEELLREVTGRFVGAIEQVPPMYSAVKIGGQKLYRLARRGVVVDRPARPVFVHSFLIERVELPAFDFRVTCSKGTYVRSLVHDLGAALGCGGHLQNLRRTMQGPFGLDDAIGWETLCGSSAAQEIGARVRSIEDALEFLPSASPGAARAEVRAGLLLSRGDDTSAAGTLVRLATGGGRGFAVARAETEGFRVLYVGPSAGRAPRRTVR